MLRPPNMLIVAVTRVLDEDDVVEAFVRHTLSHVDRILLLDNGSTDRTPGILQALRDEGLPLTVLRSRSPVHHEAQHNTLLYHTANQAYAPDWVLHLDADEFIDTRRADLRARLAAVPAQAAAVFLPLVNYYTDQPDASDLLVPRRFTLRDLTDRGVRKCMLRGRLPPDLNVGGGNHEAWLGTEPIPGPFVPELPLAHFPERHPLQAVAKAALGRLKVLAAGGGPGVTATVASHYKPILDLLCSDPAHLLADPARMNNLPPDIPLRHDPIACAGAPLRHTTPTDYPMKVVRTLATAMSRLATSHGALLDADPAARARLQAAAVRAELLIP